MKTQSINEKRFTLEGEKDGETKHCIHNSQEQPLSARKKLAREF